MRQVRYLRVAITSFCVLSCPFCHREGYDKNHRPEIDGSTLAALLRVAATAGIHKIKFLGGEPLLRHDLPEIIRELRAVAPGRDISLITSGAVPACRLSRCFAAGLDRANLSIHGWSPKRFAVNGGTSTLHARRQETLDMLVAAGRPVKLNYVYTGPEVEEDVAIFLDWAAGKPVDVSLLDRLGDCRMSSATIKKVLFRLRGPWAKEAVADDANSLDATRLSWTDGLNVEVKTARLGDVAPWQACRTCDKRPGCREGIFALRLTPEGRLQACMDRPDLSISLLASLKRDGEAGALSTWHAFLNSLAPSAAPRHDRNGYRRGQTLFPGKRNRPTTLSAA